MARSGRRGPAVSVRRGWRDRHGRGIRASVTGPHLPFLHTRADLFEQTVASAAEYLKDLWPAELDGVAFEIAGIPAEASATGLARWRVIPQQRKVVLFRLPIERLARLHKDDEAHRRMLIESCVFRAVAELLGKDPWDLAPERFRHF